MTFLKMKSDDPKLAKKFGKAIKKLSAGAFRSSEWKSFQKDPRAWLTKHGVVTTKGEPIPKSLQIMPVYDSPDIMNLKIPWTGDLTSAPKKIKYCDEEEDYDEFLAEYFIRRCR